MPMWITNRTPPLGEGCSSTTTRGAEFTRGGSQKEEPQIYGNKGPQLAACCRAHISKPDELQTTITNSHHPTTPHQYKDTTAHVSMLVGERVGGLL